MQLGILLGVTCTVTLFLLVLTLHILPCSKPITELVYMHREGKLVKGYKVHVLKDMLFYVVVLLVQSLFTIKLLFSFISCYLE